jgi:hypothetical protein
MMYSSEFFMIKNVHANSEIGKGIEAPPNKFRGMRSLLSSAISYRNLSIKKVCTIRLHQRYSSWLKKNLSMMNYFLDFKFFCNYVSIV